MDIKILTRTDLGKGQWDAFVNASDEAWLWHLSDLQDALSTWPNFVDISIGLIDLHAQGQLAAILPLHLHPGSSISSLSGPALLNNLTARQTRKIYQAIEKQLNAFAEKYKILEATLALSPMTPAYTGENCPRVNPLLFLGCENTLTQTWIIDLSPGKDALWQQMEGRARTAIRKAQKHGVYIRQADLSNDVEKYYALHCETYQRTNVPPHPKAYFQTIWRDFLTANRALILFAECGGEVVAAENFGIFKKRAIYWMGAASKKGLEVEANSSLQWTAMQWMVDHGFRWYETGEAFPDASEGKNKGLNDFKKSFGGDLYPYYKGRIVFNQEQHRHGRDSKKISRFIQRVLDVSPRKIGMFTVKRYRY